MTAAGCLVHFVHNTNYLSLLANNGSKELEKLPVNDKITVSPQTNMSPKQYIKCYKQQN